MTSEQRVRRPKSRFDVPVDELEASARVAPEDQVTEIDALPVPVALHSEDERKRREALLHP